MSENSKIEWTTHTFNPWRGCTKVSPGCTNCYAERMSARNPATLGVWGDQGTRVIAAESYWRQPLRWDRWAREGVCHVCAGKGWTRVYYGNEPGEHPCEACDKGKVPPYRARVFCASLADVFEDRPDLVGPRQRLFHLIGRTSKLDWLLLTKRPENVERFGNEQQLWYPQDGPPRNVWLGVSVENQEYADERIPLLLQVPAAVRFLSCEPLLSAVSLTSVPWDGKPTEDGHKPVSYDPLRRQLLTNWQYGYPGTTGVDWVIVGGESGPGARPCDLEWVRGIVRQCQEASVPVFVKQLGSQPFHDVKGFGPALRDKKGGEPSEWPEDIRVRQFPA